MIHEVYRLVIVKDITTLPLYGEFEHYDERHMVFDFSTLRDAQKYATGLLNKWAEKDINQVSYVKLKNGEAAVAFWYAEVQHIRVFSYCIPDDGYVVWDTVDNRAEEADALVDEFSKHREFLRNEQMRYERLRSAD